MKVVYKDREYEVPDFDTLTFREAATVKRLTGLRVGEWSDAFRTNDPDMLIAILVITLKRSGVAFDEEELLDSPAFSTVAVKADEEDAAGPPAEAAEVTEKTDSGSESVEEHEEPGTPLSLASTA